MLDHYLVMLYKKTPLWKCIIVVRFFDLWSVGRIPNHYIVFCFSCLSSVRDQTLLKLESSSDGEILTANSFYSAIQLYHTQTLSVLIISQDLISIRCLDQLKGSVTQAWQIENEQNLKTAQIP